MEEYFYEPEIFLFSTSSAVMNPFNRNLVRFEKR